MLALSVIALAALGAMGATLMVFSLISLARPSDANTWRLFKFASVYMLVSFTLLTLGTMLS